MLLARGDAYRSRPFSFELRQHNSAAKFSSACLRGKFWRHPRGRQENRGPPFNKRLRGPGIDRRRFRSSGKAPGYDNGNSKYGDPAALHLRYSYRTTTPASNFSFVTSLALCQTYRVSIALKKRLAVLGSGRGTNLDALARYCARPDSPLEIVLVATDLENAGIRALAESHRLNHLFIPPGNFRTKLDETAEARFIFELQSARVDLVVLAGFMRILKGEFLRAFSHRVVNIHPSLLPSFPGLEAWKQALDHGVKITGCTVHFVDQGIDSGAIIAQQSVPVLDGDTPETLHARIQQAEWQLYPPTIERVALGRVKVIGRRCFEGLAR